MKIIAIYSSHRVDKGYTRFLIDLIFKGTINVGELIGKQVKNYSNEVFFAEK